MTKRKILRKKKSYNDIENFWRSVLKLVKEQAQERK